MPTCSLPLQSGARLLSCTWGRLGGLSPLTLGLACSKRRLSAVGAGMEVSLVKIDLQRGAGVWTEEVKNAVQSTRSRMYAWFGHQEPALSGNPPVAMETLRALAALYEVVGRASPTLDVVPLLPEAGWTPDAVSAIADLTAVAMPNRGGGRTDALTSELAAMNERRTAAGLKELGAFYLPPALGDESIVADDARPDEQPTVELLASDGSDCLQYRDAAVGGTFDSLHAGHRLLLATAALVTTQTVWLGIASDALLAKKSNVEVMERYDERESSAVSFLQRVRPSLAVQPGALTDPAEPPLAATMEEMQALVVSRETIAGANWINEHRETKGFRPLEVVVVGLIGAKGQDASAAKLSSSALRERKAGQHKALQQPM